METRGNVQGLVRPLPKAQSLRRSRVVQYGIRGERGLIEGGTRPLSKHFRAPIVSFNTRRGVPLFDRNDGLHPEHESVFFWRTLNRLLMTAPLSWN